MNLKRTAAISLIAIMLLTALPIANAGTFPDVLDRHSWAAEYIEDMVSRGLIKGYTDGTFKPDNPISKLEAVILAARILGITEERNEAFAEAANEAYADELADYNINYKSEAAYLLYWKALKISELPQYIGEDVKNTAMKRHEVAALLTKVMGGEAVALSNSMIVLDYADADTIPASAKAYVQYVNDEKIMQGMEDNKFMPMFEVTRAQIATMMHRTEAAMDAVTVNAVVESVTSAGLTVKVGTREPESLDVPASAVININGLSAPLSGLASGQMIQIHYQDDEIRMIEGLSAMTSAEKTGVVKTVANDRDVITVVTTPTGTEGETSTSYVLADVYEILIDNKSVSYTALRAGYYVMITVKEGKAVKIVAETKESTQNGTITDIDMSGEAPIIVVTKKDGTSVAYGVMAEVVIIRNNEVDTLRGLSVGDNVELAVSAGRIKRLTATSVNKTVEGVIEGIVISTTSPSVTIKTTGGQSQTYAIAPETAFYVAEEQVTIYDMKLGASAVINLKSESIDRIKIAQTAVASQLIGTIVSINPVYSVMILDVVDGISGTITQQTVVAKSNVKIIDNTATKISALRGLTAGRSVIVLGELDNYGTYAVNTIIVTQ